MFEVAELGRKIAKREFNAREPELHAGLLAAQRRLRSAEVPLVILVSGVEGAGKGDVVSQLHAWMDARGLETHAFWDETDEERMRPRFWRFWRALPPRGRAAVLFGSWYTQPIIERALKRSTGERFDRELERIRHFESMLVDDGALLVKLWFHLSQAEQQQRLEDERRGKRRKLSPLTQAFSRLSRHHDRRTERRGTCPPLSVAVLATPAAPRLSDPIRSLVVRPRTGRAGRGLCLR